MADEYRIRLSGVSHRELDEVLRRLPHFDRRNDAQREYVFRTKENHGAMPSAVLRVIDDGVYVCSYDGPSFARSLLAAFPPALQNAALEDWE
jgi:hypothetical protein